MGVTKKQTCAIMRPITLNLGADNLMTSGVRDKASEADDFERMAWVITVLALWHWCLNLIHAILLTHHLKGTFAPTSLAHAAFTLKRNGISPDKVLYQECTAAIDPDLAATIVDKTRVQLGYPSVEACKVWNPTLEEFQKAVHRGVEEGATVRAGELAKAAGDDYQAHTAFKGCISDSLTLAECKEKSPATRELTKVARSFSEFVGASDPLRPHAEVKMTADVQLLITELIINKVHGSFIPRSVNSAPPDPSLEDVPESTSFTLSEEADITGTPAVILTGSGGAFKRCQDMAAGVYYKKPLHYTPLESTIAHDMLPAGQADESYDQPPEDSQMEDNWQEGATLDLEQAPAEVANQAYEREEEEHGMEEMERRLEEQHRAWVEEEEASAAAANDPMDDILN
ncbi:hypothetical protein P7C70_g7016, partial [Phenoliferia sp. Uapishka_3]